MPHIHKQALLPFSDQQMFDLVNDVAAYPQYLAGCEKVEIFEQSDTAMVAKLHLSQKGIKMAFTTSNELDAPKSIVLNLHDGPFSEFEGRWFFQHLDESACKVMLDLTFTLSNKLTGFAAKQLFDSVANNMVDAMVLRAKQVYGQ